MQTENKFVSPVADNVIDKLIQFKNRIGITQQ